MNPTRMLRATHCSTGSLRGAWLCSAVALALTLQWPALAAMGGDVAPTEAGARTVPSTHRQAGVDARVALVAKELDLDAGQQATLRRILEEQRNQTAKAWSDASVPSALRVKATQAISERTADQIRALLNEEQRKKYIQARPSEAKVGAAAVDVESWMNKGTQK